MDGAVALDSLRDPARLRPSSEDLSNNGESPRALTPKPPFIEQIICSMKQTSRRYKSDVQAVAC